MGRFSFRIIRNHSANMSKRSSSMAGKSFPDDDFDFEEPDMSSLSVITTSAGTSKAGSSVGSNREDDVPTGKACTVCGQKVHGKKKYCLQHHRAFECISRSAAKQGAESAESVAFRSIFGCKREAGMPTLASRVLTEFCERFPDGKEKSRQCRGALSLTSFVDTEGSRQAHEMEEVLGKPIDEEAFHMKIPQIRPWNTERVTAEWKSLLANPAIRKDFKGPPYSPQRCFIPGWYLAEDKELDRNSSFHERRVDTASKAGKASLAQREQYINEAGQGFVKKRRVELDQMSKALPSTAATATATSERPTGTSMDMLNEMAASAGIITGAQAAEGGAGDAAPGATDGVEAYAASKKSAIPVAFPALAKKVGW